MRCCAWCAVLRLSACSCSSAAIAPKARAPNATTKVQRERHRNNTNQLGVLVVSLSLWYSLSLSLSACGFMCVWVHCSQEVSAGQRHHRPIAAVSNSPEKKSFFKVFVFPIPASQCCFSKGRPIWPPIDTCVSTWCVCLCGAGGCTSWGCGLD